MVVDYLAPTYDTWLPPPYLSGLMSSLSKKLSSKKAPISLFQGTVAPKTITAETTTCVF